MDKEALADRVLKLVDTMTMPWSCRRQSGRSIN